MDTTGHESLVTATGTAPSQRLRAVKPEWLEAVEDAVRRDPLSETRPSLDALAGSFSIEAPGAVFVGFGVCNHKFVSEGLPVDALAMLLSAERMRRAAGARVLVVSIADEHALSNDFDRELVEARAAEYEATLRRIKNCFGLDRMKIVRASDFHPTPQYQEVLREVEIEAQGSDHAYFVREAADIEFMHRIFGSLLKVGWTISSSTSTERKSDEVAFDQRFRRWMGNHVAFVYGKAGRVLDDARIKSSPYIAADAERRLCLRPGESARDKLDAARDHAAKATIKGVRKHLNALTRSFSDLVVPLRGTPEEKVDAINRWLFGDADAVSTGV